MIQKNMQTLVKIRKYNKPQIKAPRVTPLEGVSTYAPQGIRVRGVENPQGFGMMNADTTIITS
ncbi:MAG: hypothetical protein Q8O17_01800 [Candidatus Methanoperedens sp.]|nr:hypothetical protein [Candidatus Methanoperedens sp.]